MNESTFNPINEPDADALAPASASDLPSPESADPADSAPLPPSAEEEPLFMLSGRKRKTIWPFFVIPLACILLVCGIFSFWYTRPKTIIKQTLNSYARTWVMDNDLLVALASASDGGRIHMELSNKEVHPTPITMDLFPSKKGNIAKIAVDDEEYRLYATPNAIMVGGSPLGDKVYGVKPQGLYRQFESSIFYPQAEGKYAIPFFQYELNDLQKKLGQFEQNYSSNFSTDRAEFGEKYYNYLIYCLLEEGELEITKRDGKQIMEIALSPEALENVIYSFFSTLTEDEELIAYLDTHSPWIPTPTTSTTGPKSLSG